MIVRSPLEVLLLDHLCDESRDGTQVAVDGWLGGWVVVVRR